MDDMDDMAVSENYGQTHFVPTQSIQPPSNTIINGVFHYPLNIIIMDKSHENPIHYISNHHYPIITTARNGLSQMVFPILAREVASHKPFSDQKLLYRKTYRHSDIMYI